LAPELSAQCTVQNTHDLKLPNTFNVLGPTEGGKHFSQHHTARLLKLSFGTKD